MKIRVCNIPEDGRDYDATVAKDPWFAQIIRDTYGDRFPDKGQAAFHVTLLRSCDNVQANGQVTMGLKPVCDRCAETFERDVCVPLHLILAPSCAKRSDKDPENDLDDIDFAFYKDEEIDFADLTRELLVLSIPIRELCSEECKGLCPRCGINLNRETCACKSKLDDPQFAVLKKLKK